MYIYTIVGGECKDVTVGKCELPVEAIVGNKTVFKTIEQCQEFCGDVSDCDIFRFKTTTDLNYCVLYRFDYRETDTCIVFSGPAVNFWDYVSLYFQFQEFLYIYICIYIYSINLLTFTEENSITMLDGQPRSNV